VRTLRAYTRAWRSIGNLRQEVFYDLLSKEDTGTLFDDKFIEGVLKRRDHLANMALKLTSFQIPIFALLLFALIPIEAQVSVLGITPTAGRNLREVLVVASAILGIIATLLTLNRSSLAEIVKAYTQKKSKGQDDVRQFLNIGYGIDLFILPKTTNNNQAIGWGFGTFLILWIAAIVFLFCVATTAAIYVHFLILKNIYVDPSYSRSVSLGVIAFVLGCDFVSICNVILNSGMIPLRDYSNVMKLSDLSAREPKKAEEIHRQIARRHRAKPWLLRLLTRPKIPKKLD
jgi:hypothetical protein